MCSFAVVWKFSMAKKKTLKRAAESVIIGSGKYKFIQEIFKIRLFIL